MEFRDVIRRRRMVRHYQSVPVPAETVAALVELARRSPSAGNAQAVSLVVLTQPQVRAAVATLAGEADYLRRGFDPWLSSAPVLLVLCVSEEAYRQRYREPDKQPPVWPVPYWWVDAGAMLENLLLAAVDAGLTAGFLGAHRLTGIGELLGIPSEVSVVGVVTLGHAAPDRKSGSLRRGRRPLSELLHWEHW